MQWYFIKWELPVVTVSYCINFITLSSFTNHHQGTTRWWTFFQFHCCVLQSIPWYVSIWQHVSAYKVFPNCNLWKLTQFPCKLSTLWYYLSASSVPAPCPRGQSCHHDGVEQAIWAIVQTELSHMQPMGWRLNMPDLKPDQVFILDISADKLLPGNSK